MKDSNQSMEILEAYDLFGSYNEAARAVMCSPNTVKSLVVKRKNGILSNRGRNVGHPTKLTDVHKALISELVEKSEAQIRANVVHQRLLPLGYCGDERSTRRAVARFKTKWKLANQRVFWPWIPEPSKWAQYDFSDGPAVNGTKTTLFHYYLPFSRFRMTQRIEDQSLPNVFMALDACFRETGGCPSHLLTDNAKTATQRHIARVAVINQAMAKFASHYGFSLKTCVPYDPASKGGVEAHVRVAKEHLCPRETNLVTSYATTQELDRAIDKFNREINARVHGTTGLIPSLQLAVEQKGLSPVPTSPYLVAFGVMRKVEPKMPIVRFQNTGYSVPAESRGAVVYVRVEKGQVIIVTKKGGRIEEIARHQMGTPHSFVISPEHKSPDHPVGPVARRPVPTNEVEKKFMGISEKAITWLERAASAGEPSIEKSILILAMKADRRSAALVIERSLRLGDFRASTITALVRRQSHEQISSERSPKSYGGSTSSWLALTGVS